ncbi:PmoA family protein [Chitinophaga solisilvae]|uniref:DUF6807 domain-containing protein n=1 Tax=Chitinophaga solisilvae TaxID=1233460 RepID=UPI00136B86A6|nr:PmoA family protein [Chitinophaga solisilvae]
MIRYILAVLLSLMMCHAVCAQVIARYAVAAGKVSRNNCIVRTPMPATEDTLLLLEELSGNKRIPVPVTINRDQLWWIMSGITPAGTARVYELRTARREEMMPPRMQAEKRSGAVVLQQGPQLILQYNSGTVDPPAGADSVFRRSAFIHPLWAPNGAVLTSIFPNAGHRHHMGIWNPWTHTLFEGRETDFWNVQKKQGKVRFVRLEDVVSGGAWCGFTARQEHVAFLKDGKEKIALQEAWLVRAYPAYYNGARREWDFTSRFRCAESEVTLLQYRYGGGFGLRATPSFTAQTSQVLTSEGKTRKDADSTRARWVKITGATPQGTAGMLIMSAPENYDSPEPLRVWPENMEGGELMFNFTPTRNKSWQLTNGNVYTLSYRVMVFSGDLTPEEAELAWQNFAHPPVVTRTL